MSKKSKDLFLPTGTIPSFILDRLKNWRRNHVEHVRVKTKTEVHRYSSALAAGYLEDVSTTDPYAKQYNGTFGTGGSSLIVALSRTGKALPKRKYRPPKKGSIWPWSLVHHWDIIQESPVRVQHQFMSGMVEQGGDWKSWRAKIHEISEELPVIHSKNQLKTLRACAEEFIRIKKMPDRTPIMCQKWFMSGENLTALFTILMVDPVIRDGAIVSVDILPEDEQLQMLFALHDQKNVNERCIEVLERCKQVRREKNAKAQETTKDPQVHV